MFWVGTQILEKELDVASVTSSDYGTQTRELASADNNKYWGL